MKAARVHKKGEITIEEVPVPAIGDDEVLIAVRRVGICGTDVGVVDGHVAARYPVTLGHEFSGIAAKVGRNARDRIAEGDPVIAGGGWGCGSCDLCRQGRDLYCRSRFSLGRTVDGCLAEFVKVDRRAIWKLPPGVSLDEAQNTVNIACALRAVKKLDLGRVETAAVFGPGNAGLIILQLLKLAGVPTVAMAGTRDFRLEMARRFGAEFLVNIRQEEPAAALLKRFPEGLDAVFEATGRAAALQASFDVVRSNGSVVVFGIVSERMADFDPSFLYLKEPVIYGSKGAAGMFDEALQLLEEKRLQILPMITHRFPLDETAQAFALFSDKNASALRILIEVGG